MTPARRDSDCKYAVSLFSGAGIGDLGFRASGLCYLTMCELEEDRAALARLNFPEANVVVGDVAQAASRICESTLAVLQREQEELFLLCCTAPCQGMSKSGQGTLLKNIRAGNGESGFFFLARVWRGGAGGLLLLPCCFAAANSASVVSTSRGTFDVYGVTSVGPRSKTFFWPMPLSKIGSEGKTTHPFPIFLTPLGFITETLVVRPTRFGFSLSSPGAASTTTFGIRGTRPRALACVPSVVS